MKNDIKHLAKKTISVIICAAMLCTTPAFVQSPASHDKGTGTAAVNAAENEIATDEYEYTENDDGEITITKYTGTDAVVSIPSQIDEKPVTRIDQFAFSQCTSVSAIIIPESISEISSSAFSGCSGLSIIMVNEENEYFSSSDGILYDKSMEMLLCCPGGKTDPVTIPDTVLFLDDRAFWGCAGITEITIPDSVCRIGDSAFYGCTGLKTLDIPQGVSLISDFAFEGCSSLEAINVDNDNLSFYSEDGVLFNFEKNNLICCPGGKTGEYAVPDGVTAIGWYAFYGCSGLTGISIPQSVTGIWDSAFRGCTGLQEVIIPDSVIKLDSNAFSGCTGLTSVTIGKNVEKIRSCTFYGCKKLTSVTIPESVTSIEDHAFYNCKSLKSITIPESVTEITPFSIGYSYNKKSDSDVKTEGFTVYGRFGSEAESFAKGEGFAFTDPDHVHIPGDTVKENEKSATCTKDGKYDKVIRCTVCGEIISKKTITTKATGHKWKAWEIKGNRLVRVCRNDKSHTETKDITVKSITLTKTKLSLKKGKTTKLEATIRPANATRKRVTWTTSDKKIATVDNNGNVKAVGKGTATITAKTSNGIKAKCKVTVTIPATKIKLNKTKATLKAGKSITLKSAVTPKNSTDKLTWSTSDQKIATVKNGKVTAKKAGKVTITVKTASGKKADCKITVKK